MSAQSDYPNLNPSGTSNASGSSLQNAKDTVANSKKLIQSAAGSAYNSIANHPTTQSLANGPAAQRLGEEKDKTSQEFSNVLNSRQVPDAPAATGQPLTHYHSMFYNILSWQNPRVTTIAFASTITFIFFTRYVPVLKYLLKASYIVLGITAGAEVAGKLVMNRGLASQVRPRKYWTIPRSTLESSIDDFEQFLNFFVIEFQRVVFAENVYATIAAFASALIGYFLVKFVPKWGIALIATTVVYTVPLVYIKNRRVIDEHLNNASNLVNEQAGQIRDLAAQHTSRATELAKSTASDYSAKAQELIGSAKARASSPSAPNPANLNPVKNEPEREITKEDFPAAPSTAPTHSTEETTSAASQFDPTGARESLNFSSGSSHTDPTATSAGAGAVVPDTARFENSGAEEFRTELHA